FASDIILGGIHNWLEVSANNHRTVCNINPNTAMKTYNQVDANFDDIYVVEKTGTKQGWSNPSPDEDWFTGYPQEMVVHRLSSGDGGVLQNDSVRRAAGEHQQPGCRLHFYHLQRLRLGRKSGSGSRHQDVLT
ncbi:MAG: hypothetical protein ACYSWQ_08055, partial [Planctomycetota bacterium]